MAVSGLFDMYEGARPNLDAADAWHLDGGHHRAEARRLIGEGKYPEAERHLSEAVTEADVRNLSPNKRIRLRLELADLQRRQAAIPGADPDGDWTEAAERVAREAIEIAAQNSDGPGYILSLDALSDIFADRGDWASVEATVHNAIQLSEALPHPDPIQIARRQHRLGVARHLNGRPEEAVPALEQALALRQKLHGQEHEEVADVLAELGKVYRAQDEPERAQEYFQKAFRMHRMRLGDAAQAVYDDLHQLAGALEEAGDLDGAVEQYEKALHLKERQLGLNNLDELAEMQYGLANLYVEWDIYSRARELLADCIGAFRRKGGPRLAVAYETLAQVEEYSGRHLSAIRELENAAKAWEKCGPDRTMELVRNLEYRADLLDELRRHREAGWLREKAAALLPGADAMSA